MASSAARKSSASARRKKSSKTSFKDDDDNLLSRAATKVVGIGELHPNPRNYKPMTKDEMSKEIESIKKFGLVVPIVVRSRDGGGYSIIDGEHRWLAMQHLGQSQVHVMDVGEMSESDADQLMIILNELRGKPRYDALGALVAKIADEQSFEDMVAIMPFPDAELRALAALGKDPLEAYATNKDAEARRKNTPDSAEWETIKVRVSQSMRKVVEGACAVAMAGRPKVEAPPEVRFGVALEKVCADYMNQRE